MLPIAFVSGILVAVPIIVWIVVFGVLNGERDAMLPVMIVATLVALIGPVVGLILGIRAGLRRHGMPRVGGWMVFVGCLLQVFLVIGLSIAASTVIHTGMVAVLALVLGGLIPAILNLIGGILGLLRPSQ